MSSIEFSHDHFAELTRLSQLVLSPFEPLQRLKTESLNLESLAWHAMGEWHQAESGAVDDCLACTSVVEPALKEIAAAYGLDTIEDSLKAAIYLGHRARFLNHEHAIWEGGGWWTIECQYDQHSDGTGEKAPAYFGVAYRGAPAPMGDIVSFSTIDSTRFTPDPLFPICSFWDVLKSDNEWPSGIVAYESAYREARKALALHISQLRHKVEPTIGIQHLKDVMLNLPDDPGNMLLWVSLLAHAVLLDAL